MDSAPPPPTRGGVVELQREQLDREHALRESEERYRAVISSLQEGIVLKDREGRTLAHNAAAERILGVDAATIMAHRGLLPAFELVDESSKPFAPGAFPSVATIADGSPVSDVVAGFVRADGSRMWVSMNSRGLFAPGQVAPHAVVLSFSDITERKLSQERLARHAYFDALTDLPNRVRCLEIIEERIRVASRGGPAFAVLYMDLDGFKRVNDTLGHAAGDELLQAVAERFRSCTREVTDTVARLGGDEFTMVLADVEDSSHVELVARRLLASVAAPITVMGHEVVVGVSIGCAMYPDDGRTVDRLTRSADHAMYQAKQAGKNRVCFHSAAANDEPAGRLALESELRRAIERSELELYCQPKVEVATRALMGFEVLVRWNHPTRGFLPPAAFLPAAQEGGLLGALTAWVLQRACAQSAEWLREGRCPPRVAVNVSANQVDDHGLVELVTRVLAATGLPPSLLELEVTEDAVMANRRASSVALSRLRDLGVTVAVDDFGTGYSSLSYLAQLPIDTLKIDRSFVTGMNERASTRPIVAAILSMARALGLSVVAEGVETAEQLAELAELGCDNVQGYYIGKPMPASELAERFLQPIAKTTVAA